MARKVIDVSSLSLFLYLSSSDFLPDSLSLSLSACLPVYLFIYLSTYLSI